MSIFGEASKALFGSGPKAPNPSASIREQSRANLGTAIGQSHLNYGLNSNTPYGSLNYSQTGSTPYTDAFGQSYQLPKYTATQTLNPGSQRIFDNQQAAQGASSGASARLAGSAGFQNMFSQPLNANGLPDRQFGYGENFDNERKSYEDAIFSRYAGDIDQERGRLFDSLAQRGIQVGSAGFNDAYKQHRRGVTDARSQAVLGGAQEHSRLTGLAQQRAAFSNAGRDAGLNERAGIRTGAINEVNGLQGGQIQQPNFRNAAPGAIANTDTAGIRLGSAQLNYKRFQDGRRFWSDIAGAAAAAAPGGG